MHRQQSWHVIGQVCKISLGKALLLLVQWDSRSSLKCGSIWPVCQHLAVIHHWICHTRICWTTIKISQGQCWILEKMFAEKFDSWFIQIFFFIEGSCNRPYLCGDFLLLLCQMFMTLFNLGFHESCFFLRGKQLVLFFVGNRIDWLNLSFLFRRERLSLFFVFGSIFLKKFDLSDQEKGTCNVFLVQQHFSCQIGLCLQVKGIPISCYVHQHQFVKWWFFYQEEGTHVVFCVHQHYCIKFELFLWWEWLSIVLMFSGISY